jgi:hypothetical protein
MSLTVDDKAYIIGRMLSTNPASGLSTKDYREKIGVMSDPSDLSITKYLHENQSGGSNDTSHRSALQRKVKQLFGGLSEDEAAKIMATTGEQIDPRTLVLGVPLIDHSSTNAQLQELARKRAKLGVPSTSAMPTFDRPYPDIGVNPVQSEPLNLLDMEEFSRDPDGLSICSKSQRLEAAGVSKTRKPRRPLSEEAKKKRAQLGKESFSVWQEFYSKTSKWKTFDNMKGNKRKAISLLYKAAKKNGAEAIKLEKKRFDSFEQFCTFLKDNNL